MKGFLSLSLLFGCVMGTLCAKIGDFDLEDDYWWGPKEMKGQQDTSIRNFSIEFTDEMINDLVYRLKNHRPFVPPLEGQGFQYGFNSDQMQGWIDFWAEEYQFKEREAYLNQFPQFKTNIQGMDIHFIRVTPKVPEGVKVLPILLLHGFPGSVREFYDTLPLLTAVSEDRDFALEAIVPSLPGYGFSDAAVRPGLGVVEMAVVFRNFMNRLGFEKYYIQGGDWGAFICASLATLFPNEVLGLHSNLATSFSPQSMMTYLLGSYDPTAIVTPELESRMYPITDVLEFFIQETGYFHIQSAKPDTIGIVLSDSPSALMAYVLQLVSIFTRAANVNSTDGGLDNYYSRNTMIDNLMFYWTTNTINTAIRTYAETVNWKTYGLGVIGAPTPVLTWTFHAKDELMYQPPALLKMKFPNLVNSTVLNTGGHHLAMELPELFADNVLTAVAAFRNYPETTDTCYHV